MAEKRLVASRMRGALLSVFLAGILGIAATGCSGDAPDEGNEGGTPR